MNDLSYSLLVDKSLKRKVTILSMMLEASSPIPLETISHRLRVTQKTTQQDITFINEQFPDTIKLLIYNGVPSLHKISDNHLITNHLNTLVENNPLFFVIESIFNGNTHDSYYYSDKLFISDSTLKKHLSILRSVLEHYSLTLSTSPIDIIGNEMNIRYFYFQYFRYGRKTSHNTLRDDQYMFVYNTIQSLIDNYGLVLNVDYYRVASWLLIFETRLEQQKFVQIPKKVHDKYKDKASYLKFKSAVLTHFSNNPLSSRLNDSEILFCYLTRLDTIIYEEHKSFFTNDFFYQFKNFEKLILSFFEKSNLGLSKNISLVYILQAYLTNLSMLTELTPLFQTIPYKLTRIVEKKYPATITIWHELLKKEMDFSYAYDVAINLTLLTETKMHKKKNILFVLTGESSSVNFYKENALKCTPYDMNPIFVFNAPLDNNLLEKINIDLCVCNLTPPKSIDPAKLFRLSDIPLESEWQELLTLLYNI